MKLCFKNSINEYQAKKIYELFNASYEMFIIESHKQRDSQMNKSASSVVRGEEKLYIMRENCVYSWL